MKKAKKCKVCEKLLAINNESMLCNFHAKEKLRFEKEYLERRKRKEGDEEK